MEQEEERAVSEAVEDEEHQEDVVAHPAVADREVDSVEDSAEDVEAVEASRGVEGVAVALVDVDVEVTKSDVLGLEPIDCRLGPLSLHSWSRLSRRYHDCLPIPWSSNGVLEFSGIL